MNKYDIEYLINVFTQFGKDEGVEAEVKCLQVCFTVAYGLIPAAHKVAFFNKERVVSCLEATYGANPLAGSGADVAASFFTEAAAEHGQDSESDHEAGDLQEYLRAACEQMLEHELYAFLVSNTVMNSLELALSWELPEDYPKPATIDEKAAQLEHILLSAGYDESDLDDLVHDTSSDTASRLNNGSNNDAGDGDNHDAASQVASDINNEGMVSQIKFLLNCSMKPSEILHHLECKHEDLTLDIDFFPLCKTDREEQFKDSLKKWPVK